MIWDDTQKSYPGNTSGEYIQVFSSWTVKKKHIAFHREVLDPHIPHHLEQDGR
jgi:hypothetical protein